MPSSITQDGALGLVQAVPVSLAIALVPVGQFRQACFGSSRKLPGRNYRRWPSSRPDNTSCLENRFRARP